MVSIPRGPGPPTVVWVSPRKAGSLGMLPGDHRVPRVLKLGDDGWVIMTDVVALPGEEQLGRSGGTSPTSHSILTPKRL